MKNENARVRGEHLPAQSEKEPMQGVRRGGHLPARSEKEPLQGVRRGEHLPARSAKERVQGVRRRGHLPARSDKEQVQDVQSRQGRVHAAGSRGALGFTHTGLFSGTSAFLPPVCSYVLYHGSTRLCGATVCRVRVPMTAALY